MDVIEQPTLQFCGQAVDGDELSIIQQVIERYPGLSRTELANTLCELLEWTRPNGGSRQWSAGSFWRRWKPAP